MRRALCNTGGHGQSGYKTIYTLEFVGKEYNGKYNGGSFCEQGNWERMFVKSIGYELYLKKIGALTRAN